MAHYPGGIPRNSGEDTVDNTEGKVNCSVFLPTPRNCPHEIISDGKVFIIIQFTKPKENSYPTNKFHKSPKKVQ